VTGKSVRITLTLVWLLWVAGAVTVIIANIQARGKTEPPTLSAPKPTPSISETSPAPTPTATLDSATTKSRTVWQINTTELKDLTATLGILIGGFWAYFKFFKGRTFKPRLELTASGKMVHEGAMKILVASMEIKNIGLSQVYLGNLTRLDLYQTTILTPQNPSRAKWTGPTKSIRVFANHRWVEPEETIRDEVLIQIPTIDHVAYRLDLVVRSDKPGITERWRSWRKRRKLGAKWSSTSVTQEQQATGTQ
jgi:hypothetical protein